MGQRRQTLNKENLTNSEFPIPNSVSFPPYHWWRTVFYLIPAIAVYTIVLGTLSIASSLFERSGYFAHWCARTWSRLILATTGVRVHVGGLERLEPGRTYVFVANHQSIYDIPILFWSLPYQLRIIAKESLGRFPFLGWHLRRTGHMLVDRRRPDRAAISTSCICPVSTSRSTRCSPHPEGARRRHRPWPLASMRCAAITPSSSARWRRSRRRPRSRS